MIHSLLTVLARLVTRFAGRLITGKMPIAWVLMTILVLGAGGRELYWRARLADREARIRDRDRTIAQMQGVVNAFKALRPGETQTIRVPWPFAVPGPVQLVRVPTPVVVTRTERFVETVTKPVVLPPEEITRILEVAPQSISFDVVATRNITAGERFRLDVVQIAPGTWQALLPPTSPVDVGVTGRIHVGQLPAVDRWTFRAELGVSSQAGAYVRVEGEYRLNAPSARIRQYVRASAEHQWQRHSQDYRLAIGGTW